MRRHPLAGGRGPARQASPRRAVQHEKGEQANGVALLQSMGAKVYTLGTRRSRGTDCPSCGTFVAEHQGTRQTPGIADVLAFLKAPTPDHPSARRLLWWEVKRPGGGRLSADQVQFRALCQASATDHVDGDLDALIAWLIAAGYLRADRVPHYRLPKEVPCT